MTSQTRKEVEAHLIELFVEARKKGLDCNGQYAYVRERCPGVPDLVLTLAAVDAEDLEIKAWWQTIEKTIDGEIIQRALASPDKKP